MRWFVYLVILILSLPLLATLNDVDKAMIFPKSILKNGGFENGKADWSVSSGSFSITSSGSNLLTGKVSALWDASAASITLSAGAVTVPNGLKGKNGVAVIKTMVPSGTAAHSFQVWDGTSVLGTMTIASSTIPTYQYLNFIMPGSGTVSPRLVSSADEPMIVLDDAWLGDAQEINLTNISQATFIGSAYFATTANCLASVGSTTIAQFGTDSDCPGPTVESNPGPGVIQTTDSNFPRVTLNNLPPGRYKVTVIGGFNSSGGGRTAIAIYDGSTFSSNCAVYGTTSGVGSGVCEHFFEYSTSGNRSFEIYGATSSGNINWVNDTNAMSLKFLFERYPLSSEQAYRPSQVPFLWRGRHPQGCSWSMAATTISTITVGDASSCTLAEDVNVNAGTVASTTNGALSLTPGIVWTPPKTGIFQVCTNTMWSSSVAMLAGQRLEVNGTNYSETMGDSYTGTAINELKGCAMFPVNTLGGITVVARYVVNTGTATLNGSSTYTPNKTIDWSIIDLSNSFPAPLLLPIYPQIKAKVSFDNSDTASDLSGTYSRTGTTVTVTATSHNLQVGHYVYEDFTSGTAVDGAFTVTSVIDANNFTTTHGTSGSTSGNITLKRRTVRSGSFNIANITNIASTTGQFAVNFSTFMSTTGYTVTSNCAGTAAGSTTFNTSCFITAGESSTGYNTGYYFGKNQTEGGDGQISLAFASPWVTINFVE